MTSSNHLNQKGMTYPADRPPAAALDSASPQVTRPNSQLREPNTSSRSGTTTPPPTTMEQPARRIGKVQRARLRADLMERDTQVLASLERHRFLTSHQVQGLHFRGHASPDSAARATRRVLRRLERSGLIRAIDRRRGGIQGGSVISTWYLTDAGYKVLTGTTRRYRIGVPTVRFLQHTLAIADAHIAVEAVARDLHGYPDIQIEREATRRFAGLGGSTISLRPDLFAAIHAADANGAYEDRWFVEVDCGTESLPTLLRKCEQYEAYYRSGTEQAGGGTFPLVLWIFHGTRAATRLAELRRRVLRSDRLTPELFRYATADTVTQMLIDGGAS